MKLRDLILAASFVMTASACSTSDFDEFVIPTTSYPLSSSELALIQDSVRAALGDPGAGFVAVRAVRDYVDGDVNACGLVVSPAALGHDGPVRFFGVMVRPVEGGPVEFGVVGLGRDAGVNQTVADICARYSMPM